MGSCNCFKKKRNNAIVPDDEMRILMQQHLKFLNSKNEGTPRLSISDSSIYIRRQISLSNAQGKSILSEN